MALAGLIVLLFGVSAVFAGSPEERAHKFEGDIKLTPQQKYAIENGLDLEPANQGRGASKSRRWTNGVFPYVIASSLSGSSRARQIIQSAMREWSEKTCIRFVRRSNQQAYAEFFKGGGCWSYVGMTGRKQQISLAGGCWHHGIAVHEIGHALGFWHEQSRPDRDEYVTIMWDNIPSGNRHNFNKYPRTQIDSLNVTYDYGSIMHYGRRAFSNNGKDTIVPKKAGVTLGQRRGLSSSDVKQMNLMYKCSGGGGGGNTTPRPRPTSESCRDLDQRCPRWTSYCTNNDYVKTKCKKTCGNCGNCKDNNSNCKGWTRYCNSNDYVKKNCLKSCGRC